jgi:hypothetical protein
LASRYISEGIIPEGEERDAAHVAFATVERFPYHATMNQRHIRRAYGEKTKRNDMGSLNAEYGIVEMPAILKPEEILEKLTKGIPAAAPDQAANEMEPSETTRRTRSWMVR